MDQEQAAEKSCLGKRRGELQLLAQTLAAAVEQMRDIFIVSLVFVLFMATIGLQLFQVRVWQRRASGTLCAVGV